MNIKEAKNAPGSTYMMRIFALGIHLYKVIKDKNISTGETK